MSPLKRFLIGSALLTMAACAIFIPLTDYARVYGPAMPQARELTPGQAASHQTLGWVSFEQDVKPIIDTRCVVCHGCYDAPCQLKLESGAAIDRGASKGVVYDGQRLHSIPPTRMGVDADSTTAWRKMDFFPVLNERGSTPAANLDNAVLAKMLKLKQAHPPPTQGRLPADFRFDLNRSLECPTSEEFERYANQHPDWGMPYGLPPLKESEHQTLMAWLAQGARYESSPPLPEVSRQSVSEWEGFLNGERLKDRLMARYLFEHLFIGHLHFKGHPEGEFFRMVRSTTPPGEPIAEIATVRPYDDPGPRFWYRLRPLQQTIVDKNHLYYELSPEKMSRLRALFLTPDYSVAQWPGYQSEVAGNPFLAFEAIPPKSRYRFLLDDAYFFISSFMKGPVCRGQVALNVIRSHFWVFFYDPERDPVSYDARFIRSQKNLLRLPSEKGEAIGLGELAIAYTRIQMDYQTAKNDYLTGLPGNLRNSLEGIWYGEGSHSDAAMTVFRHFDSASLSRGLLGEVPHTAWLVDYPLMERLHYLLVAGFNVFGSVTHQAATRLHMDYLRAEGENNFLSLLPARERPAIYRHWNRGPLTELKAAIVNPFYGYGKESAVDYQTEDHKTELMTRIARRMGALVGNRNLADRCTPPCQTLQKSALQRRAEQTLRPLIFLKGGGIQYLPELSFLRVHEGGANFDRAEVYSLVKNQALMNVAWMSMEGSRRLPEEDTLSLVTGFVGSYPNQFFDVTIDELPRFVERTLDIEEEADVTDLVEAFGIRRTHPRFWDYSDFFNRRYHEEQPLEAGLFDLNRYENR